MESSITKLFHCLNEGDEIKAESIEESIAESIEEALKGELFFSLPTNEIVKIIQKSDISKAVICSNIISKMYEAKGGESALILNILKAKEATFEEPVKFVPDLSIFIQKMERY